MDVRYFRGANKEPSFLVSVQGVEGRDLPCFRIAGPEGCPDFRPRGALLETDFETEVVRVQGSFGWTVHEPGFGSGYYLLGAFGGRATLVLAVGGT